MELTYEQAKERAETLAKRMGPQWQIEIWENTGWHYRVHVNDAIYISPVYDCIEQEFIKYHARIGRNNAGLAMFEPEGGVYPSPHDAVVHCIKYYKMNWDKFKKEQETLLNDAYTGVFGVD